MKKILIVEDDYYIGDIYVHSFTNAGYQTDLAIDGNEALEKTKENSYDMILLDIMLPKQNGIEVLRILRSPTSSATHTPVYLITNLGQENIISEAFKIGADGCIFKAKLTPKEVVKEIESFLIKRAKSDTSSPPKVVS